MKVLQTLLNDVFLIKPKVFKDIRGSFSEQYQQREFNKAIGMEINFCQNNLVYSNKGVLRGLHYQLYPYAQSKLVCVLQGTVLDLVVDIRKGSPTFGQYFSQELSAENQLQLFIPRGFAHGYITLSETSIFQYKVDNYYNPQSEGSIRPDDPILAIDWQLPKDQWIQSKKDQIHPSLSEAPLFDFKDDLYA